MLETTVHERGDGVARLGSLGCLALITALGIAGCGNELPGGGAGASLPAQGGTGAPVAQTDPGGGFFASISANGTGCPPGSILSNISSDGQAFTIAFSAYQVEVSPGVAQSTKNCNLSFKLESPKGLTFAIPAIYYSGYAFLEEGVRASQTATYNFRNSSVNVAQRGKPDLVGPYDNDFVFEHGGTRAWAACGTRSIVNVNTQLRMQNVSGKGSGLMNLAAVDGNVDENADKTLVVNLAWRPCQAPVVRDAGTVSPGVRATDTGRSTSDEDANDVWMTPRVRAPKVTTGR